MNKLKCILLFCFFIMSTDSFCQTDTDAKFIQEIVKAELKVRDKKNKKAYPIFDESAVTVTKSKRDSLFTEYLLGKDIKWQTFNIQSKYGFFTNDKTIDSCFHIHAPIFNKNLDQFIIRFEKRYLDGSSSFTTDYYVKKKEKWVYVKSIPSFSF